MFRAPLAHLQEALHKQLVYCVRFMSVGCYQVAANRHNTDAIYQLLFVQRILKISK
jgi:hypothetical protein